MDKNTDQNTNLYKIIYCIYPSGAKHVTNSFAVFKAKDYVGKSFVFKAKNTSFDIGNTYTIKFHIEQDEKYGESNIVDIMYKDIDLESFDGIFLFLRSLTSETIAKRLIDEYKDKIFDILDKKDKTSLKEIKGIGKVTATRIISEYDTLKKDKEAYVAFGNYGFTASEIEKIINHYDSIEKAKDSLSKNLYNAYHVEGISFHRADEIALNNGYAIDSYKRIVSGLTYCFNYALEKYGWSYMSQSQLERIINIEVKINNFSQYTAPVIQYMKEHNMIVQTGLNNYLSLDEIYATEFNICKRLYEISQNKVRRVKTEQVKIALSKLQKRECPPSDEQQFFLEDAINKPLVILTGSAGTGKTFTVSGYIDILKPMTAYGCALSGRAAANLKESLGDVPCTTIHKILLSQQRGGSNNIRARFDSADVIIVDEATMISGELFLSLLNLIGPKQRLVIMGDIKQLPPIGNCQIYHDALLSKTFPVYEFTKPFRQKEGSRIIPFSIAVSNGDKELSKKYITESNDIRLKHYDITDIANYYVEELKEYDVSDVQVCLATNIECEKVNKLIHDKLLQNDMIDKTSKYERVSGTKEAQKTTEFCVGDKIINMHNIYNGLTTTDGAEATCMNGEMGIIKEIIKNDTTGRVTFIIQFLQMKDGDKEYVDIIFEENNIFGIELGYACTCHKLQGSGFGSVIVGLTDHVFVKMYTREWFYTAVTRAKKKVSIFTDVKVYGKAIENCETNIKQTLLEAFLTDDERII